ncbi:hypothetical protein [Thiomicrorhabdus indica]|uniref:hypothetical protein n=1 Tax=Thiomicrorhabdus indica TaxID=2267253 RepID=UPI002AA8B744|nr:hypothetical protein [Thiomicrorhabdus indica]
MPKIFLALFLQMLSLVGLAGLVMVAPQWIEPPYSAFWLVLVHSALVLSLTIVVRMNRWWWLIQVLLPWMWYWALMLKVDPWISLGVFILVVLVFANAFSNRVPLYLSNHVTRKALKKMVAEKFDLYRPVRFLDIGSGFGGNVFYMHQLPQVSESHGVETAPIPYLVSRVRQWFLKTFTGRLKLDANAALTKGSPEQDDLTQAYEENRVSSPKILARDLWKYPLIEYDFVYAFLSTEPMPRLWEKVVEEMPVGSWFVSNSFPVPGVEPTEIWQLSDRRETILYLYQIAPSHL